MNATLTADSPPAADQPVHRRFEDATTCDGVIWFGNVDWWYHNRGHASTRMANRVAQCVPTCWINSIGMRMPVPGRTEIATKRYLRKLKSLTKGLRRDEATGMYVYSPLFVPKYTPRWVEFNGRLLAWQVGIVLRRLGVRRPSACVSMPTMVPAVERRPWVSVVFDRCDDFTTLPEANSHVAELERRLLDMCDHAAYVNQPLYERERDTISDAQMIGHGVDYEQFVAARPLEGERIARPAELQPLTGPIVGFYGGMDDYRMDAELMIRIARRLAGRNGSLVLLGPEQMDLSRVKSEPNVHALGQKPPDRKSVV